MEHSSLEVFKLNTMLHPESFNVYDSEAYAYTQLGDEENAIKNYRRFLELNPKNTRAAEYLKQHKTKK
jgi:D-alanyl-D-alanine-carboxypeptidase/D-alanyl-D-alanine-endopeptidase